MKFHLSVSCSFNAHMCCVGPLHTNINHRTTFVLFQSDETEQTRDVTQLCTDEHVGWKRLRISLRHPQSRCLLQSVSTQTAASSCVLLEALWSFIGHPRYAVENMHIHVQYGRPQRGQMCERCSVLHRNHFIDESCCQGPNIPGPWAEQEDECLTGCNYSCKQQAAARQSSTEQTQNIFVWLKQLVQEIRGTAGLCEFDSV